MQPLLLVSEESQFLIRIVNGSFQTLDIIKDRVFHAFGDLFCSKANLDVIDTRQDNVVQSVNREEQGSNDWSSKGNNSNLEGDSRVGFNVLDAMLKHSLDRLKSMSTILTRRLLYAPGYPLKASIKMVLQKRSFLLMKLKYRLMKYRDITEISVPHGVAQWMFINSLWDAFQMHTRWRIRDVQRILWKVRWFGDQALANVFPDLYNIAINKDCYIRMVGW